MGNLLLLHLLQCALCLQLLESLFQLFSVLYINGIIYSSSWFA